MMLTIGMIAAVLFVGTLLLLAFRPEPKAAGKNSGPPKPRESNARAPAASEAGSKSAPLPAVERSSPEELRQPADPAGATGAPPEPPPNYRSHEIARQLDSRGYATLKDLYFHPGSPRLRDDATGEVAVVAALLRDEPDAVFEIEGSSNGSEFLARDRAEAVIELLVNVYGVSRTQLVARGRAAGTSNVARNRRVQIIRRS